MNLPSAEKADLITELTELKANLETLQARYESQYGDTVSLTSQISSPNPMSQSQSLSLHPQSLAQTYNQNQLRTNTLGSFNSIDQLNLRRA